MRRRVVAAGLLVALALTTGWLARRHLPGDITSASAAAHGATIVRYDVRSRFVERTLPQTAAPVVVFPNGGEASYWHKRSSGDWARYVLDEVIPRAIRRLHADPRRVAIGGTSMGGYGAFAIARRRPAAFCAVAGHSPAIWLRAGESAAGALRAHYAKYLRFHASALAAC